MEKREITLNSYLRYLSRLLLIERQPKSNQAFRIRTPLFRIRDQCSQRMGNRYSRPKYLNKNHNKLKYMLWSLQDQVDLKTNPYNQSWLRDGIFSGSRIPIPGIRDRDFLFWARSKNTENPEIPGIGIGI